MEKLRMDLVQALRNTVEKIQSSPEYQWGHMGLCNCGFLAQEVTALTKSQIHSSAMMGHGDWTEQLNDYCPTSGLPMDGIINALINFGFTVSELQHLERLSHPEVVRALPPNRQYLKYNNKEDVMLYLNTWAFLLEERIIGSIDIAELTSVQVASVG
ncbi:MAG: hypothetical protein FJZ78_04525 [Bacteroidetes bacterium]|nr:hypothetical protein [Bacteroidota bacterium]